MKIQDPYINFGNITGSLLGTSSRAITSSFAISASFSTTSSRSISSSYSLTASHALNATSGVTIKEQGSDYAFNISTIDFSGNIVDVTGGGSSVTVNVNQRASTERVMKRDFNYLTTGSLFFQPTLVGGGIISRVQVVKDTVFNGTNPRLMVQIPNYTLMETSSISLTSTVDDASFVIKKITNPTNIGTPWLVLTHTGSSQGSGTVYIFYTEGTE